MPENKNTMALSPLPPPPPCEIERQPYDCTPFLRQKVLKIVMMSKDECSLLLDWTLYHGEVFGWSNLYILDGSTRGPCSFFAHVRERGVNIIRTQASLNEIEELLNVLMRSLRYSADWLIKVDTDEFIVAHPLRLDSAFERTAIRDVLSNLRDDGKSRFVGWQRPVVMPEAACRERGNRPSSFASTLGIQFGLPTSGRNFKTIVPAPHFSHIDLGGHRGLALQEDTATVLRPLATGLEILHFHSGCWEDTMANSKRAVISHGYVGESDSHATKVAKLSKLVGTNCASSHKVADYLQLLTGNHSKLRRQYYRRVQGADDTSSRQMRPFADFVRQLRHDFLSAHAVAHV